MAKVCEDNFGVLWCEDCGAELTCDENGDMPETCPDCGAPLDYSSCTKEEHMQLNDMDLIRSMDWLEWAQKAHERGLSQEDIDRRAIYRLQNFGSVLSAGVLQIYEDSMAEVFDNPGPGRPEKSMTSAAATVIKMATEKDWAETLAYIDGKTEDWRKIWDAVRSAPDGRIVGRINGEGEG